MNVPVRKQGEGYIWEIYKEIGSEMLRHHIVQDEKRSILLLVKVSTNKPSPTVVWERELCSHSE